MHGVRAPHRRGRRFRKAEVADLARAHQLRHGADRLLDRDALVDAVLVVKVDVRHAEPLERRIARLVHVLRPPVDPEPGPVRAAHVAELRSEHDAVTLTFDSAPHKLFVRVRAVYVGGIEEGDAELEGAVNRGDRFGVVATRVEVGHAHAPEAERGDDEPLGTEFALFHHVPLRVRAIHRP